MNIKVKQILPKAVTDTTPQVALQEAKQWVQVSLVCLTSCRT